MSLIFSTSHKPGSVQRKQSRRFGNKAKKEGCLTGAGRAVNSEGLVRQWLECSAMVRLATTRPAPNTLNDPSDRRILGRENESARKKQWNPWDDWDHKANHSRN